MTQSKKPSKQYPLKKRVNLWFSKIVLTVLGRVTVAIPERWAYGIGRLLGDISYALMGRYRKVALTNLNWVFGQTTDSKGIRQVAKETFRNFGKCGIEFLRLPHMSDECLNEKVKLVGIENLDKGLSYGRGVILITAHFGNWELLGARLVQDGYPINVIARDADDADMTRMINGIREGRGYRVFSRSGSMLPVVRCLKNNQAIAILADQHDHQGIFVDFFGKPAKTPTGPAAIALMTGAVLVPTFCARESDDRFTARFYPPIEVTKCGDKDRDIYEWTARITKIIEEQVRLMPNQWLWLHNRWKSKPPADLLSTEPVSSGKDLK